MFYTRKGSHLNSHFFVLGGLGFSTDQIGTTLLCVAVPLLFLQIWLYPKVQFEKHRLLRTILYNNAQTLGEPGWQSFESTCLPPMWPGFDSQFQCHICGLSLLLVLILALRGFSPGTPVFSSPQKLTFRNSNSIWNLRATGLSVVTDC